MVLSVGLFAGCEPDLAELSSQFGSDLSSGGADTQGGATSSESGGKAATNGGVASTNGGAPSATGGAPAATGGEGNEAGAPMADTCKDHQRSGNESDVDCGGDSTCPRCDLTAHCSASSDCLSGACFDKRCVTPSCSDRQQDQDETDVDCGGSCAPTNLCTLDQGCAANSDCDTHYCDGVQCADHCGSNAKEADETDVDCGGASCDPCEINHKCKEAADCQTGVCTQGKCVAPTCDDELKNQDETDLDCGGSCSPTHRCAIDRACLTNSDCETYVCNSKHCAADIAVAPADVIDDMEDHDLVISKIGGRVGGWYSYNDGTAGGAAQFSLATINRGASTSGYEYSGSGFTNWGAGCGFDFYNPSNGALTKQPYDVTAYSGITFWAKAVKAVSIVVAFPDQDTSPAGMKCTTCDHHWNKSLQLSTDWQRYTILFQDLQLEPGTVPEPTSFDAAHVLSCEMRFNQGVTFDILIDDIALIP